MSVSVSGYIERRRKNRAVYCDDWEYVDGQRKCGIKLKHVLTTDSGRLNLDYDMLPSVLVKDMSVGTATALKGYNITSDAEFDVCTYHILTLADLKDKIKDIKTDIRLIVNTTCDAMCVPYNIDECFTFDYDMYDLPAEPCIPISKRAIISMISSMSKLSILGQLTALVDVIDEYSCEIVRDEITASCNWVDYEVRLIVVVSM